MAQSSGTAPIHSRVLSRGAFCSVAIVVRSQEYAGVIENGRHAAFFGNSLALIHSVDQLSPSSKSEKYTFILIIEFKYMTAYVLQNVPGGSLSTSSPPSRSRRGWTIQQGAYQASGVGYSFIYESAALLSPCSLRWLLPYLRLVWHQRIGSDSFDIFRDGSRRPSAILDICSRDPSTSASCQAHFG